MSQVATILRHEWRQVRRRPLMWIVLCLYLAVGWMAATTNQRAAREEHQRVEQLLEEAAQARRQATAPGDTAVLPVAPLAAVSVGQSDLLPRTVGISVMNKQRTPEDRYGFENPDLLSLARLDPAAVLVLLLPLIVIALAHDLLARERDDGVLLLVLAAGGSIPRLLAAKVLLLGSLIVVATLAPVAFATRGYTGAAAADVLVWHLAVISAVLFWLLLAARINMGPGRAGRNAAWLLGSWVGLTFVAPAAVQVAAAVTSPIPSRLLSVTASRENPRVFVPAVPELAEEWYQIHGDLRTAERHPGTVLRDFNAGFFLVQNKMDLQAAPHEAALEAALERQQAMVRAAALIVPSIGWREALDCLAGTDVGRYQAFRRQAEAFRVEWRRFVGTRVLHGQRLDTSDHLARPAFTFAEPRPRALNAAGVLVGPALGVLLAAVAIAYAARRTG